MKILNKRRKNWLVLVTTITGIYFIINIDLNRPTGPLSSSNNNSQPQWILSNSVIEHFDDQGDLAARVYSDEASFYAAGDKIEFSAPVVELYQFQTLNWQGHANQGTAHRDSKLVTLSDDVVLNHRQQQQTLTTQWLSADFNKSLLKTDKAVTIATPDSRATAIGMVGNWKDNTLNLLDDVHVQITPRS